MIRDQEAFDTLVEQIRKFVQDVAIPNENRVEAEDRISDDVIEKMKQLGSFGWSIPEEFGGAGLTSEELAIAFMEFTQCSVAFRVYGGQNAGIGSECIIRDGTPEQKQAYLPKLASGKMIGCLALTEEGAGSDATAMKTRAKKVNNGYRIKGSKCYITLAPVANLFTIFARTEGERGGKGVTAFLVERGTEGLSTSPPTPKMGQEGAPIGEVYLDDIFVPDQAVLGGVEGIGFKTVMKALNKQRINLSALSTGPAIRMLNDAIAYAKERRQFDQAIGEFQLVQAMLAECKVEIEAARALILETARKRDRNEDVTMDVSLCKYFSTEMCGRVADKAVQVFGGAGYVKGTGIERFYRDVRAFRIYEGTSQIHLLNIARNLLK